MATISLHYERHKGAGINGLGRHNERKPGQRHANKNIRAEDTHKNIVIFSQEGTYSKRIDDIIKKEYTGAKAVRKDAVKLVSATVQLGSEAKEWDIDRQVNALLRATVLLIHEHGKQNVVSAVIHVDETTPHLHFDFVPMINGRLSAKDVIGDKNKLKATQKQFRKNMRALTNEDFQRKEDATYNGLPQELNDRLWQERKQWEEEKKKQEQKIMLAEKEQTQKFKQTQMELAKNSEQLSKMLSDAKKGVLQNDLRERDLNTRETKINARTFFLGEKENEVAKMLENAKKGVLQNDLREKGLNARESDLNERERLLNGKERDLEQQASRIERNINASRSHLFRARQMIQDAHEYMKEAQMKRDTYRRGMAMENAIQDLFAQVDAMKQDTSDNYTGPTL